MNNIDVGFRLKELSANMKKLVEDVKELSEKCRENELWDNADIIRNWKVSARTLATWRAEGLIGYVQVGSKIWYPKEVRELFLKRNLKKGGISHGI